MTDTPTTAALRRYRDRVDHFCQVIATSPDSAQADELPEVIAHECAYLVEEGAEAYLAYVNSLEDATVRADLDRELTQLLAAEQQATTLPVALGGGPIYRCSRCTATFTAATWHVIEDLGERDGRWFHTDVCRRCADADPELSTWQDFCDIADAIDALMRTAPGKRTRRMLAAQLKHAADHFAEWRWPEEADA